MLHVVCGDITTLKTDAIVNAANEPLRYGSGVCGAIFRAAGVEKMQRACDRYGHCDVGKAVITGGFDLNCRYVIHTVGPRYQPGHPQQASQLASCYTSSLDLAKEFRAESIAFPLISTGVYGYPKEEAAWIAVHTIGTWLKYNHMDVVLCVLDPHFAHAVQAYVHQWQKTYG